MGPGQTGRMGEEMILNGLSISVVQLKFVGACGKSENFLEYRSEYN